MPAVLPPESIDVGALRIGMYVHLDIGWMAHPFPVGSFKLTSAEQLATIRGLGIERVRWSPQHSDVDLGADAPATPAPLASSAPPAPSPPAAPDPAPVDAAADRAADALRRLGAERAALQLAERQFAEAARDCRRLTGLVAQQPHEARTQAEALTQALLAKMLPHDDLCIRLLTDAAGDKASLHAVNVTVLSLLMGRSCGLADGDLSDVGVGALLHDIGKIDLPDRVRHLDDHATPAEIRLHEEHVQQGVLQARRMALAPGAAQVVAQHHENADGSGFPLRVRGERMSEASRIVALVNRYDNLCNPVVPARALTPHESLALLFAEGRATYDAAILAAFIRMMGVYPPGSLVQLTDDRYAMVVAVDAARPLKPRVLVHEPRRPSAEASPVDLGTVPGLGIRRSVRPQALPPAALACLSPRPRMAYFFEPGAAYHAAGAGAGTCH